MGTPIPPPIETDPVPDGDLCSTCWGPGKPFGDGDTPESLTLNFSGINKGPNWLPFHGEPLEGEFIIPQSAVAPCTFDDFQDLKTFILRFLSARTTLIVISNLGVDMFLNIDADICEDTILNDMDDPFTGGSCKIIFPEIEP